MKVDFSAILLAWSSPLNKTPILTVIPLLCFLAGCENKESEKDTPGATQAAKMNVTEARSPARDPHAGIKFPGNTGPTGMGRTRMSGGGMGVVRKVIQAGNYTYVELDTPNGQLWVASNYSDAKPGEKVAWRDGAIMRNFHSKALDRDFEEVMFISGFISPDSLPQPHAGVVVSRQDAAGYTYLEIDTGKSREWVALPTTNVEVGTRVQWLGGSKMINFHSNSLNRSFDSIWFISKLEKLASN